MSPTPPPPVRRALRGDLLHFRRDPGWGEDGAAAACFEPDGWLLIEAGRVVALRPAEYVPDASWSCEDWRGHLLLPGFVDAHVHAPQLDVIASANTGLLDWLEHATYPAELRWADAEQARAGARRFVRALLAHGSTAALAFASVHPAGVDALFEAARELGMRLLTGKVMMDRHCPPALQDDAVRCARDCAALIERWHGVDRLAYAVTPRFAGSSTPQQLDLAGRLLRDYSGLHGGLYLQTHLAETRAEVRWIAELFPRQRSYLDVYAAHGLLGARSVFAHGIWLDAADRAALAAAGSAIAFSPSSNLFLGSGLFDWESTRAAGVAVAPSSDVGAGTSLCQLRTLADAYKVLALQGQNLTAWQGLYAVTRGAARLLGLEHEIGHFDAGACADVVVWRWADGELQQRRQDMARSLHERLFAWMLLGDERLVAAVYVQGRRVSEQLLRRQQDVRGGALGPVR
jgi:guanine deaminase